MEAWTPAGNQVSFEGVFPRDGKSHLMRFHTFVLKNVARRPVRSALTVLGMAIAVGAVVSLVGISQGFQKSFLSMYSKRKVALIVVRAGAKQRLLSVVNTSLGEKIAAIPGVKQVNAGLIDMTSSPDLDTAMGIVVQGWPADCELFDDLEMLQGSRLIAGDHGKILLGRILAQSLGKKVGDTLTLYDEKFEIKGIYDAHTVYENGGALMLLEDLQKPTDREGKVSGFSVVLDHPKDQAEVDRVRHQIEALDKNLAATPTQEFVSSTTELQIADAMAWITSAVALIIGVVFILSTMLMSVSERTREIGILRAIGWGRGRIVRMILLESVLLSLSGGVAGTVIAIVMTQVLSRMPAVAGMIDSNIPPPVIGQGFLIAVLVGLIAAAYPAYYGAQLLPTEAIRHE